jgi:hypothetical protein
MQKISYAVVKKPTDFQKTFWLSRKVKILEGDLTEFAIKLAERFDLEIPQLGITKKDQPSSGTAKKPIKLGLPIKVLFLAANPERTPRLRLDEEIRDIQEAVRKSEHRDQLVLIQEWAVRVKEIQEYFMRHKPAIVHFSGHGESNEIIFEDKPVAADTLSNFFSLYKETIRCVLLNACDSEPQARAIAEHIDCVIGMSSAITDEAAKCFSRMFYLALGEGRDLKAAFDTGCMQIKLEFPDERATPKLIARRRKR